jgi:D-alanyl-D-alanine carboxypeptidase (penicillin-binding protein 5/6)
MSARRLLLPALLFVCCSIDLLPTLSSPASADPSTSAQAALLLDADTGEVLFEKNPHLQLPMASTTKVMTALLGVERLRPHELVQVSAYAASMAPSKIHLRPGELIRVDDLLQAILLKSANDASAALAEKVSGSEAAFARLMTRRARDLGAVNTHFENASGLPADGHYSTAYDLAIILRYAMQRTDFAEIMQMKTASVESVAGRMWNLRNHNRLLWTFPGALGGKTGWTRASRHCYVGMVQSGERTLIVSVLASTRLWDDIQELLLFGFSPTEVGEPRFIPISSPTKLTPLTSAPPPPAPLPERRSTERRPTEAKRPEAKSPAPKPSNIRDSNNSSFTVQVGAFREKQAADLLRRKLRQQGYSAFVTASETRKVKWYRVRVGDFDSQGEAKRFVGRLKSQTGLEALIAAPD